jgi:hypothetical protein
MEPGATVGDRKDDFKKQATRRWVERESDKRREERRVVRRDRPLPASPRKQE